MSSIKQVGELQVNQDLGLLQRIWKVQRVGWGVMLLLLLLALAGLFGPGPLSSATAGAGDGSLSISYNRFARFKSSGSLRLSIQPQALSGDEARLWLSSSYLDAVQVQRITPQPDTVESDGERVFYIFKLANPSRPLTVNLTVQFEKIGSASGQAGLGAGQPVSFSQFIYP